ncbi:MAG: response regulator [Acidimicrobiales bacterium]
MRVLLVDDHTLFCQALSLRLAADPELQLAAAVHSAAEAIDFFRSGTADVAVVDVGLGEDDGIELTRRLRQLRAAPAVVVLTCRQDKQVALEAMLAGAFAFLPKSAEPAALAASIRAAARGEMSISPDLLIGLLEHEPRSLADAHATVAGLSAREQEILRLMVSGLGQSAIAASLFISINTVRTHTQHVLRKLGVKSRTEAVAVGLRAGLRPDSLPTGPAPLRVAAGATGA